MKDVIDIILATPTTTLLMVAGFVFLFISVVGNVAGKIEPGKAGRIAAGVIGGILLVTGLALQMTAPKIEARQAEEAEARNKEEESRRQAEEEARAKAEAERVALKERARKQRQDEEAQQAAEAEARNKQEESRRQAEEEARAKAEAERVALKERARKQRHTEARQTTDGWAIIGSYQRGSFSELVLLIDGDSPAIGRSYKATQDFRLVQKGPEDNQRRAVITLKDGSSR